MQQDGMFSWTARAAVAAALVVGCGSSESSRKTAHAVEGLAVACGDEQRAGPPTSVSSSTHWWDPSQCSGVAVTWYQPVAKTCVNDAQSECTISWTEVYQQSYTGEFTYTYGECLIGPSQWIDNQNVNNTCDL